MTEQELRALQVATRTCHHSYEHWPLTAPRRMPWLNDEQKNAWTAPFTRVLFDQLAKEAQRGTRRSEEEERRTQQQQTQQRRRRWWKSLAILLFPLSTWRRASCRCWAGAAKNKERKDPCVALHLQPCRILGGQYNCVCVCVCVCVEIKSSGRTHLQKVWVGSHV